jgi:hypothetical protein
LISRYLVDLEAIIPDEPGKDVEDIITPKSDTVLLFGVWNQYAYRGN